MANPEILLRSILGDIRPSIRPLACAADIISVLFFEYHVPLDEINAAKQVYPAAAELLGRNTTAAARSIQRLSRVCWDSLCEKDLVCDYIGQNIKYMPNSCRLIGYLAVYSHLHIPFFKAIEMDSSLLFSPSYDSPLYPADERLPNVLSRLQPRPVSQVMCFSQSAFPVCPGCGTTLEREYQKFCDRCGQCLCWKNYSNAVPVFPGPLT